MLKTGHIASHLFCALLGLGLCFNLGALAQQKSSSQGVYTKFQAEAGAKVYSQYCAGCHGAKLQGGAGPALSGDSFAKRWESGGKTADDLYSIIHTQMPKNAPGSLKEEQYLDVLAYILQENGYKAGGKALSSKDLKGIKLSKP